MLQDVQPIKLLLPLYDRTHILADRDGEIWMFREFSSNGAYPRYTLKGETLSKRRPRQKAHLFAALTLVHGQRVAAVLLGTWMLNRLIVLVRQAGRAMEFRDIYGYLGFGDGQRARAFFARFDFQIERLPDGREKIFCPAGDLRIVPEHSIQEIAMQTVVREWYDAKYQE